MRLILASLLLLAACEKYTDATSPCFGANGEPAVGRSEGTLLAFDETEPALKDCIFEPIGADR